MAFFGSLFSADAPAPAPSPQLSPREALPSLQLSLLADAPPAQPSPHFSDAQPSPHLPDAPAPQPSQPPTQPEVSVPQPSAHAKPPPPKAISTAQPKVDVWTKTYFDPSKQAGVRDMINLPNLTKKELMDSLKERFDSQVVYTYIGDIVVSINPFTRTKNSDLDVEEDYIRLDVREQEQKAPPHIFCLVGQIYEQFQRGVRGSMEKESLSILISGESGAGKTEAMKLCVRHLGMLSERFARAGHGDGTSGGGDSVAQQLMATNPIMEPIGNAKTVRNNNSSRFGKHFDIQFNKSGQSSYAGAHPLD